MPPKPRARTYLTAVGGGDSATDSGGSAVATDDDDYRQKRDRNNVAVKKSREKSRKTACETAEKMDRLRRENAELEQRTVELASELRTLKELLLARAASSSAAARRGGAAGVKAEQSPSTTSTSSRDVATPADPRTVTIDHEYTSTSSS